MTYIFSRTLEMQWSGVTCGYGAYESLPTSQPSVLSTSLEHVTRDVLPTQNGASYIDRTIDVGRLRKTWRTEQPLETISTLGGCLRPLWESSAVEMKERKTTLPVPSMKPVENHKPVQHMDRIIPPLMEKPHMSYRQPNEMLYEVPQFSGYGARHALPTEYVEKPGKD